MKAKTIEKLENNKLLLKSLLEKKENLEREIQNLENKIRNQEYQIPRMKN